MIRIPSTRQRRHLPHHTFVESTGPFLKQKKMKKKKNKQVKNLKDRSHLHALLSKCLVNSSSDSAAKDAVVCILSVR